MRRTLVVSGALLAGALGACGGSARSPSVSSALPQTPAGGAVVFKRECSYCHSLIGNESLHRQGGDLLGYSLTRAQLLQQTRQMPVRHPLSAADLNAVVDYVESLQQRARHSG